MIGSCDTARFTAPRARAYLVLVMKWQEAIVRAILVAIGLAVAGLPAGAQDRLTEEAFAIGSRVTADTYLGFLNATSSYSIYLNGERISRLDWRTDSAAVVGVNLAYAATDRVSLRLGGWAALPSTASNVMNDYDWLRRPQGHDDWSDHSEHPDTDLNRAFQLDVATAVKLTEWRGLGVTGLGGFRVLNYDWTANGGYATYSSDPDGWRDQTGALPDGAVVEYEQWWRTPYLGLGIAYQGVRTTIVGEIIGSAWAQSSSRDYHYARKKLTTFDLDSTNMVGLSLKAAHALRDDLTLTGGIEYQKYWDAEGKAKYTFLDTGQSGQGEAKASNQTLVLSAGLTYRF